MKLLSVSVSMGKEVPYRDKSVSTGIFKEPVSGRVMLSELNLAGDRQIDLRGHGGPFKAVCVYSLENYKHWERELGRSDFQFPQFGENFTVEGFEIVSHILTLGYAAMAAAMFFFILTRNTGLPKYRMSSVISVVVMVSALLLLYAQRESWTSAYAFTGDAYALTPGADLFTNGYRYLNWLIDVPMLLIQILFVAEITGRERTRYMARFSTAGALMILTGYVGQFYEPGRLNESLSLWTFWGLVSTAFFIYVLVLITRVIKDGASRMEGPPQGLFGAILPLFYVSWWLYPIAYAAPLLMETGLTYEVTIVAQQVIYTVADISSKVVYGIMLTATATMLSRDQGYAEGEQTSAHGALEAAD